MQRLMMLPVLAFAALLSPALQAQGTPIKVGIVVPHQGPLSDAFGIPTMQGGLMAIEDINAKGGVKGRQLVAVVRDDRGQAPAAVTAFQELARDPDVVAILGPSSSGNAMAVRAIINEATLPQFALVYGPALTKSDFAYFYRMSPALDTSNAALLAAAQKKLGNGQKLATLSISDAGGVEGATDAANRAGQYGMTVVAQERYTVGDTDLTAQLARIKASGATVLLSLTQGVSTNAVVRGMRQLGMNNVLVVGPNGLADAQAVELAGNLLNGVVFWDYVCFDEPTATQVAPLRQKYEAKHKRPLSPGVINGYDSVQIMAAGLEQVIDGNKPVDRKALNGVLTKISFNGVGARYDFAPDWHNGPRIENIPICTYRDGKRILFK